MNDKIKDADDFWLQEIARTVERAVLPAESTGRSSMNEYQQVSFSLDSSVVSQLDRLCGNSQRSLHTCLLTGIALMLSKISCSVDVTIGVPMLLPSGRLNNINPVLPVSIIVDDYKTFKTLLLATRNSVLESERHQMYPLEEQLKIQNNRHGRMSLFDIIVFLDELHADVVPFVHDCLSIRFEKNGPELTGVFIFDPLQYSRQYLSTLGEHFNSLLFECLENPDHLISSHKLVGKEEEKLLFSFNGVHTLYDRERSIPELLEAQVKKTPDRIALSYEDKSVSFSCMNELCNQLASALRREGLPEESIVGLMADRSIEMIIGMFGIIKAGAAYLPLSLHYPPDRIRYMTDQSKPWKILTQAHLLSRCADIFPSLPLESLMFSKQVSKKAVAPLINGESLLYVIYTSGSTGYPKGVKIHHRNVHNLFIGLREKIYKKYEDALRIAMVAPLEFDASVQQIVGSLLQGNELCIVPQEVRTKGAELWNYYHRFNIHISDGTPSHIRLLIEAYDGTGLVTMPRIKHFLIAGEVFPAELAEQFYSLWTNHIPLITNLYGPTETCVDSTSYDLTPEIVLKKGSIFIGNPLANQKIYILNERHELSPIGFYGELYIGGEGVSAGYIGAEDQTKQRFIEVHYEGEEIRMFKTGDIGRWLPDGNIEFAGRKDNQVKINGYRIEPEEIEQQISKIAGIKNAVVIAEDYTQGKKLIAYIVPDDQKGKYVHRIAEIEKQEDSSSKRLVNLLNGLPFYCYNQNEIKELYKEVFEGPVSLDFFPLGENPVLLDVGANIGMFTLHFSNHCEHGKNYAIEPVPALVKVAKRNFELHNLNVKILEVGVGSKTETSLFTFYPNSSGMSGRYVDENEDRSLLKKVIGNKTEEVGEEALNEILDQRLIHESFSCQVKTISQILRENNIAKIDLLKLDVEKGEYDALLGIETDDWGRIENFLIELHDIDGRLEKIKTLLTGKGYHISVYQESMYKNTELYTMAALRSMGKMRTPYQKKTSKDRDWLHPFDAIDTVKKCLVDKLPPYMIPGEIRIVDQIPLTYNGKLDRKRLSAQKGLMVQRESQEILSTGEQKVYSIWKKVLGFDGVGVDDDFFSSGGNSILAIRLVASIFRELSIKLPLADVFNFPTVRLLAGRMVKYSSDPIVKIPLAEAKEYYPLTSIQQRLYFLHQRDKMSIAYNIPQAVVLRGIISKKKLEDVFRSLITRHESFRTSFVMNNEEPVQVISDTFDFNITYFDLTSPDQKDCTVKEIYTQFIRPFDLAYGPLLRVALVKTTENENVMITDLHHIISDGESQKILIDDFTGLYEGKQLSPPVIRYRDFAVWQNSFAQQQERDKQESFWLKQFHGDLPLLDIPTDFERTLEATTEGKRIEFSLEEEIDRTLKSYAEKEKVTLFQLTLSLFALFLSKLSQQEDIVIGTPVLGRPQPELKSVVGLFVNTLAIRCLTDQEKSFADFLHQVRKTVLEAFENQYYPLDNLINKVVRHRDGNRNPLFDVFFVFHSGIGETQNIKVKGLELEEYLIESTTSKFDLMLEVVDSPRLRFILNYKTSLFKESTVHYFISLFKNIITEVLDVTGKKMGMVTLLPNKEITQLITSFNSTDVPYKNHDTVATLFERQASKKSAHVAIEFSEKKISYRALNEMVNQYAHWLAFCGLQPGQIAAVMLESPNCIALLLAILKSGASYLPIDPRTPKERIKYILADSGAWCILGSSERITIPNCDWLDPEEVDLNQYSSSSMKAVKTSPKDTAYVIYTSGSTGKPKGVVIQHDSLSNYISFAARTYLQEGQGDFALFSSIAFDLTITSLFTPLVTGNKLIFYSDESVSDRLKRIVEENNVNVLKLTPSHLKILLADEVTFPTNSKLKTVVIGGEALDSGLVRNFVERCGSQVRIYNEYGPTEATVGCMIYEYTSEDSSLCVPIGQPIDNAKIYLLDRFMKPVAIGVKGQLYISGHVLAAGYLNNPELTANTFAANPYVLGTKLYSTGDIARRISPGCLEFIGRADDQVKIRGNRVELSEIRQVVILHSGITDAAVISKRGMHDEYYLCAYFISPSDIETNALKEHCAKYLPEYMVPAFFMRLSSLPLTINGKIDSKALPSPEVLQRVPSVLYGLEKHLADLWCKQLGLQDVGIDENYFDLGGDSIRVIKLAAMIHRELDIKLGLSAFFAANTIRKLARLIQQEGENSRFEPIKPAIAKAYYRLSSAQQRTYVLQQLVSDGVTYNISQASIWTGNVDRHKLESIFKELINRHESLRTSFAMIEAETAQMVHDAVDFAIDFREIPEETIKNELEQFRRPFNLMNPPLMRVGLFKVSDNKHYLIVDMHHIISDGVSHNILLRDFESIYKGKALPIPKIQYKDYAEWQQNQFLEKGKLQESYWLKQFESLSPALDLPSDFKRPAFQSFSGASFRFIISKERSEKLHEIIKKEGVTPFMLLSSIYYVLLAKLSGQEDVTIGTPVVGRRHADLYEVVGMFINTLVLRAFPEKDKTFSSFLKEVKKTVIEGFENQEYPYEALIEKVVTSKDASRNPLFDTLFVYQDPHLLLDELDLDGITIKDYPELLGRGAKFDLTLFALDRADQFEFIFEYNTKLFSERIVRQFHQFFDEIVNAITTSPDVTIGAIDLLTEKERTNILQLCDRSDVDYPRQDTVVSKFEEQVNSMPDAVCGIYGDQAITFSELNARANSLAHFLVSKGLQKQEIVPVLMEPSLHCMVTIFGIIKAGGAYLPIDPSIPAERINFMISDAQSRIIIVRNGINPSVRFDGITIEIENDLWTKLPAVNLSNQHRPDDLLYIIYTSGTTGQPKGVMIEHRQLIRLIFHDNDQFDFGPGDGWTLFHSYTFDFSVWELFGAVLTGGKIVWMDKFTIKDPVLYFKLLVRERITVVNQTPSAFYNLLEIAISSKQKLDNVRYLIFAGETLKSERLNLWRKMYPHCKNINMYGTTETTVHVTYLEVSDDHIHLASRNVGWALPTLSMFALDADRKLLPERVIGELYVGGSGLGRGYLNRPELTRQRFIDSPFQPGEKLYRTGDLGRIMPGGFEHLGRIDHQVQLRGYRIELGEIESCILRYQDIQDCAVLAGEENGNQYLVAYLVTNTKVSQTELTTYMRSYLPDYMVPSYFVEISHVPLTINGKLNRSVLPRPLIIENGSQILPRNEMEEMMAIIWKQSLHIEKIGVTDNYFNSGGDSIKAIRLVHLVNKHFDVSVGIAYLYAHPTIEAFATGLLGLIEEYKKNRMQTILSELDSYSANAIIKHPYSELVESIYPMSEIEKGMVFHYLKNVQQDVYFEQVCIDVKYTAFDPIIFLQALDRMVNNHPILRTGFDIETFQHIIYRSIPLEVPLHDISSLTRGEQKEVIRQYLLDSRTSRTNFTSQRLWWMTLYKITEGHHILVFELQHAILDGWSFHQLLAELNNIYGTLHKDPNYAPKSLKCSYRDFIAHEFANRRDEKIRSFWKTELQGYRRWRIEPAVTGPDHYSELKLELGQEYFKKLQEQANIQMIPVNHICFAAYLFGLNVFSYDNDIVAGLTTNTRPFLEDGEKVLGCFLNTIPVRMKIPAQITWLDYLLQVHKKLVDLKNYEQLSLGDIVEVTGERSNAGNPFFDTKFNYVDFYNINELVLSDDHDESIPDIGLGGHVNENTLCDIHIYNTNGVFNLICKYNTGYISDKNARKLIVYVNNVLNKFIGEIEQTASKQAIMPELEVKEVAEDFNATAKLYPRDITLQDIFKDSVSRHGDKIAIVFNDHSISYNELNVLSDRVAVALRTHFSTENKNPIIGIMMDRSPEMMIGIWGIVKSGSAYLPLSLSYPLERIQYLLRDSAVKIVLGNKPLSGEQLSNVQYLELNKEMLTSDVLGNCKNPGSTNENVYVIYTSGTSGYPKGVLIKQFSMLNRLHWMQRAYPLDHRDVILFKTPYTFDVSVWEIFWSVWNGAAICILPDHREKDPDSISKAIVMNKVSVLHFVPSMLRAFLMYFTNNSKAPVWKSIRRVFASGEALTRIEVSLFYQSMKSVNPAAQLVNLYGPTEATVDVSYFECSPQDGELPHIPIGKPIDNIQLLILDKNLDLQPTGVLGELVISGHGVGEGYLNRPELTSHFFRHAKIVNGNVVYRTGDLARFRDDGNIEYFGRLDYQVKIRGHRIELGEIQHWVMKFDSVTDCAIIDQHHNDDRVLVGYVVATQTIEENELKKFLSIHLPAFMIPSWFVQIPFLPKTEHGKMNTSALAEFSHTHRSAAEEPQDEWETRLLSLWKKILETDSVGVTDDFFNIGGHSIKAMSLTASILKDFGVQLIVSEIFEYTTIRLQAEVIKGRLAIGYKSIPPAANRTFYPLSSGQSRMLAHLHRDPTFTSYNINQALLVEGAIDIQEVEKNFGTLLKRHESLRTSFREIEGKYMQEINENVEFTISLKHPTEHGVQAALQEFNQPFVLSTAPLMRVGIIQVSPSRSIVMISLHHLIADAISIAVLTGELSLLFAGKQLAPVGVQFKDFAVWQTQYLTESPMNTHKSYWLKRFQQSPPALLLPADANNTEETFEGKSIPFVISEVTTQLIRNVIRDEKVSLSSCLLSVYYILLARLCGQEDITIGTTTTGRTHPDVEYTVGMFVNTIPLRNYPTGTISFREFIRQVHTSLLEGLDHQDYPADELLKEIRRRQKTPSASLFDILFTFFNQKEEDLKVEGWSISNYSLPDERTRFHVMIHGRETKNQIDLSLTYRTSLFKESSAMRFVGYFQQILGDVLLDTGIILSELTLQHDLLTLSSEYSDEQDSGFEI